MDEKLRCVLVDDNINVHQRIGDLANQMPYLMIEECFFSAKSFQEALPSIEFDLCIINTHVAGINGIKVARMISDNLIIFLLNNSSSIKDAVEFGPVDILFSPVDEIRFYTSVDKAYHIHMWKQTQRESRRPVPGHHAYGLFNIAEAKEKLRVHLSDIFYVNSDDVDPRNKQVILRDGRRYTFMNCTFTRLLNRTPTLVRVNKSALISIEAVHKISHDRVSLKFPEDEKIKIDVTLNRSYKKSFMEVVSI